MTEVRSSIARPVRGGVQGGITYAVIEVLSAFSVVDFTPRQYGAVMLAGSILVSAIQNFAEDQGWIKSFLKNQPQRDEPLVDDAPA